MKPDRAPFPPPPSLKLLAGKHYNFKKIPPAKKISMERRNGARAEREERFACKNYVSHNNLLAVAHKFSSPGLSCFSY